MIRINPRVRVDKAESEKVAVRDWAVEKPLGRERMEAEADRVPDQVEEKVARLNTSCSRVTVVPSKEKVAASVVLARMDPVHVL